MNSKDFADLSKINLNVSKSKFLYQEVIHTA